MSFNIQYRVMAKAFGQRFLIPARIRTHIICIYYDDRDHGYEIFACKYVTTRVQCMARTQNTLNVSILV